MQKIPDSKLIEFFLLWFKPKSNFLRPGFRWVAQRLPEAFLIGRKAPGQSIPDGKGNIWK